MKKTASSELIESKTSNDSTIVELALKSGTHLVEGVNGNQGIRECVSQNLEQYFKDLDGQKATNLYQMVINEVEPALLNAVLEYTRGNQSKAAEVLGLNRGTLRKKLKQYHIE